MNIRTSKPKKGNKYYTTKASGGSSTCIKGKPTDVCDVLANCVGYACGRFNEIIGAMKYPSLNCNAENFIERAISLGLQIVQEPTLGGLMVWQKGATLDGKDGAGHVEPVEKFYDNGDPYTSASAYNGPAFYNVRRNNSNGRWGMKAGYTYRGCIVNPKIGFKPFVPAPKPEPTPTPTPVIGFKKGEQVVPTRLVNYTGTKLIQYDKVYTVYEDSRNDRVVLAAPRHGKLIVWAAMNIKDVRRV